MASARPAAYSAGVPFVAEQERPVEMLDVDAAILHRLEGAGVLHQTARGFVRISEGTVGGDISWPACDLFREQHDPRAPAASEHERSERDNEKAKPDQPADVRARHPRVAIRSVAIRSGHPLKKFR